MANHVVPAVIPTSFDHLDDVVRTITPFASEVQIDIVDGTFVPFRSWPYVGSGSIQMLARYSEHMNLEIDLMIMSPEDAVPLYVAAGARSIVVHLESTQRLQTIIEHHRVHEYALGFSLNNDTPLAELWGVIEFADYVQLMGIAHIGSQGQPFDKRVLDRIRAIRERYPDMVISIDGSVNQETVPQLRAAGANRFVSGSAILGATDPAHAYAQLVQE